MKSLKFLLFFACTLAYFPAQAQEANNNIPQGSLNSGTIESQFEYLNSISNNYEDYKVIKRVNLAKIKENVMDSLQVFKDQVNTLKTQLNEQEATVDQLNEELQSSQNELQQTQDRRDSFSFMGIYLHKSTYNAFMWGLVIILAIFLLFYIYRFKSNYAVTAELKQSLMETREEFEQHRRNTLERERKLNRQLVDEMNKKKV